MLVIYKNRLVKRLIRFLKRKDFRNIQNLKGLLIADCEYYRIAMYHKKYWDFIIVYFLDVDTRQVIYKYRTRTIYGNNIMEQIVKLNRRIINRKTKHLC